MHFSIPDSTDSKDSESGGTYTLYHIHINGTHHSSLRYSQLRTFNEKLHNLFPSSTSAIHLFPPKKLLSLSTNEKEDRRISLERYLQSIVQNKSIVNSKYFQEFFLHSQRETFQHLLEGKEKNDEKLEFPIFLLNGHQLKIQIYPTDDTQRLLDLLATKVGLSADFLSYFGLYLIKNDDKSTVATDIFLVRQLIEFEAPYLSLEYLKRKTNNLNYRIVLKKCYWDVARDNLLLDDRIARNLLFVQVQYELEHNNCLAKNVPNDIKHQLLTLKENNSFKEYLLLAKHLKYYGHLVIKHCSLLYPITSDQQPQQLQKCELAIGNNELICVFSDINKDITFKVTKIRCWRVTSKLKQSEQQPQRKRSIIRRLSTNTTTTTNGTSHTPVNDEDMDLSFEYLVSKDSLKWITVHTLQATLISTFLQNMVDEIIKKRTEQTHGESKSPVTPNPRQSQEENKSKIKFVNEPSKRTPSDLSPNNTIFNYDDDDDL
ncbi:unnamed protein product [Didymodactylos carnosus]|uniref:PX domain-containing protein n=1 Tax=Didymodactylos carnosus TaxID=1234261 RepID=A0A8S2DAS3_9BILA|nr:unnamed protein product [Didymodactylos carnosus]CAF3640118.1 unnamed protein product [Didymodactylos carnosus]